jgi:hypothetical protein
MVHPFLTLALDGVERLASRPGRFILVERIPGTHVIGGWVGPRAGLDIVEGRTYFEPQSSPPWLNRLHTLI